MAGRPKLEAIEKMFVCDLQYVRFHQGVQFMGTKLLGGVTMSLDKKSHAKHDVELKYLSNGHVYVHLEGKEWIVPDSIIHFVELSAK